jgi:hypothetical protein
VDATLRADDGEASMAPYQQMGEPKEPERPDRSMFA